MSTGGILFLSAAWLIILSILVFTFGKILTNKSNS